MDMEEYKAILGSFGKLIYHLMFSFTSLISNFISCRKYILRKKRESNSPISTSLSNGLKNNKLKKLKALNFYM